MPLAAVIEQLILFMPMIFHLGSGININFAFVAIIAPNSGLVATTRQNFGGCRTVLLALAEGGLKFVMLLLDGSPSRSGKGGSTDSQQADYLNKLENLHRGSF